MAAKRYAGNALAGSLNLATAMLAHQQEQADARKEKAMEFYQKFMYEKQIEDQKFQKDAQLKGWTKNPQTGQLERPKFDLSALGDPSGYGKTTVKIDPSTGQPTITRETDNPDPLKMANEGIKTFSEARKNLPQVPSNALFGLAGLLGSKQDAPLPPEYQPALRSMMDTVSAQTTPGASVGVMPTNGPSPTPMRRGRVNNHDFVVLSD